MIQIEQHHEALARLGLTTLEGVKSFGRARLLPSQIPSDGSPGGSPSQLVKDHHGSRDIHRIPLPAGPVLFLKRIWRAHKKDGLRSLLTRGAVWSICREEWENYLALQRAGIRTAGLVAFGEECGLLWERFSFIITEAAPGIPLSEWLAAKHDRARVLDALAREIRKMHDAGLFSPDLFSRHIFVDGDRFALIDMARVDDGPAWRDLAALNITAPLRFVTTGERKRFLEVYGEMNLCPAIERRMRHLAKRRKFQDFFKNSEPNVK